MRLSTYVITAIAFAIAAVCCGVGALFAVNTVENRSVLGVQEALLDAGYDWASVQADGLLVILDGEAESEPQRFRAITVAGTVVDSRRVIDNLRVSETGINTTPDFAVEILRNDEGISIIGLMPETANPEQISRRVASIAGEGNVRNLVDVATYEAPPAWDRSLAYAMDALALLPRSKISVSPNRVSVTAIAESNDEKIRWETRLARQVPDGLTLALDISAPRPVMTPFTFRASSSGGVMQFDACAVETEADFQRIAEAANAAGFEGKLPCSYALGSPSTQWGVAVSQSIEALHDLGGGTVTVSDADILLTAIEGTDEARFDDVVGRLDNSLPEVFSLDATLPVIPDVSTEGPPEFTATLSPEGQVQLRGKVTDALLNTTAENYAMARFGRNSVSMGTRIPEAELPRDWSIRVLAGIEALSELGAGAVVVQPEAIAVRGKTGNENARADISRMFIEKLGAGAAFNIDVTYDEALDPTAALPTPQECVELIEQAATGGKITFEPGSANIVAEARGVLDDIASILRQCPTLPLEIAGYTDSQGREEMNRELSQQRAEAVLNALRSRRVPVGTFRAQGYGEENPIADNDTAAGREANRRIEFTLILPEESGEDAAAQDDGANDAEATEEETPQEAN